MQSLDKPLYHASFQVDNKDIFYYKCDFKIDNKDKPETLASKL